MACSALGACERAFVPFVATTSPGCATVPPAEQRAALLHLADTTDADDPPACFDDTHCPCGSYCDMTNAVCRVDCLATDPTPELTCGAGLACTPLGACAATASTPPPPVQLTLAISPGNTDVNTASAQTSIALSVTVAANSFDVLTATSPAVVRFRIAEAVHPVAGNVYPLVRCTPAAAFADTCEMAGGWTFNVAAGELESAPRTVWVALPRTTTPAEWTLEARSGWAEVAAVSTIRAVPVLNPASGPGRYKGTITWANTGAAAPDPGLSLAVEAIATPTNLVLVEPTHVLLPDGHVVLSLDAAKATLLGWLSTDATVTSPRMDVRLDLGTLTYNRATGQLAGNLTLRTATSATTLALALAYTGVVGPTCGAGKPACATGSYCDATVNLCVAGSGPAVGGGIVAAASATPSSQLPSAPYAAWAAPLDSLVSNNATLLGGGGRKGIEHAYCYRPQQNGSTRFGASSTLLEPSLDEPCTDNVGDYAQETFKFANRTKEVEGDFQGGETFNLIDTCLADLAAQPTGAVTLANLLATKSCVSIARFFLALRANNGKTQQTDGQRLVGQLLRQWLGVNAYLASASVQNQKYADVLASTGAAAQDRLGSALDLVEQNLRVLLDPGVRPQFVASGPDAVAAAVTPDYRTALRPVAHWTFNDGASPLADSEGESPFFTDNVDLSRHTILANGAPGSCHTNQSLAVDDTHFTIVAALKFDTVGTFVPFRQISADGSHQLWVEATIVQAPPRSDGLDFLLRLVLKDSDGGSATFEINDLHRNPNFGLLAIVADGGSYAVQQFVPNSGNLFGWAPLAVTGAGPHWGGAGTLNLACNIPKTFTPGTCTSWDRNAIGDGLDVTTRPRSSEVVRGSSNVCTKTCTGRGGCTTRCTGDMSPGLYCDAAAATRRGSLLPTIFPNPPASALAAFTVAGGVTNLVTGPPEPIDQGVTQTTTTWDCALTIDGFPVPVTGAKPVCGAANSDPYAPGGIEYDEVSVWSRALSSDEVAAMSARYNFTATNDSLPPTTGTTPGQDQAAGLAASILEAATADLELARAYVDAELNVMYDECYLGGPSPARDRAVARIGRNLRTIAVLEGEAARIAAIPGAAAAPWFSRYQADQRVLAGKRSKLFEALRIAGQCKNPLGISESDLPLFNGNDGTASSDKFFGSSHFLTGRAKEIINTAANELTAARNQYIQQRLSTFQVDLSDTDKTALLNRIRLDYETTLRRFCGAPAGTQKLLDGFLAGTLNASNCFLKTEIPNCQNLASTPLASVPTTCLRGEIGEHLITIQAAAVDSANATASLNRAIDQYDGDMGYCARRQIFHEQTSTILEAHNKHMQSLRAVATTSHNITGIVTGFVHQDFTQLQDSVAGLAHSFGLDIGIPSTQLQQQKEAEDNDAVMQARSHDLDIAACYHEADNQKFAIDAARGLIDRVAVETRTAVLALDNAQATLAAVVNEAAGQLVLQDSLDRTPPHFHYWLDESITAYQRDLSFARRLTYLALRSFEYESQQSIGLRTQILTARRPDALLAVVQTIEQRNAPMQGEQGFVIGQRPVVLSMRNQILHIDDMLATPRMPGDPNIPPGQVGASAEKALQDLLTSDSSKIYDSHHTLLGHGIRFALKPASWSETSCAERISKITTALQLQGSWNATQPNLVLLQTNAFGSQECRAAPGTVHVAHVQSSHNLLVDDGPIAFSPASPFTAMNVLAQIGTTRTTLEGLPQGLHDGFSGRGIYADYILLFPIGTFTPDVLKQVKDVLIRFDIVEVTNVNL